jgi:predicted metal-dependent phosphoesterase TrpH
VERETVHVAALGIDPENVALHRGLTGVRSGRDARARRIGDALEDAGIPDAFEGRERLRHEPATDFATHFARYLIETGYVRDMKEAFKALPDVWQAGMCRTRGPLAEVVGWIHGAGGQAVIATPALQAEGLSELRVDRRIPRSWRRCARSDLAVAHGGAVRGIRDARAARMAKVSCGSDFHGVGEPPRFRRSSVAAGGRRPRVEYVVKRSWP